MSSVDTKLKYLPSRVAWPACGFARDASRIHIRTAFPSGAGEWIKDAHARHRKQLRRLANRLASLPLAIHVKSRIPFNVLHGDLALFASRQARLFDEEDVCIHDVDCSATSRFNFHDALGSTLSSLPFEDRVVRVSDTAFRNLYLTYVGHSPVPDILVHNSYVYIDQGVYPRPPRRPQSQPPTVIDHGQFSSWLYGVASAWGPAPVASSGAGIARTAFAQVDAAVSAY